MVSYACPRCAKTFEQKQKYDTHYTNAKRKCKITEEVLSNLKKENEELKNPPVDQVVPVKPSARIIIRLKKPKQEGLKFIDLFSGIGGFHLALKSLGAKCVLACDIDEKCREMYEKNFGIKPKEDITKLNENEIPDFDILCGGFPCQAFSHAGKQNGLDDTRGTLFRDVCRILRAKKPKYFLLENVKNLKGHDGGKTWITIHKCLVESGYKTYDSPIVLSPHQIGVPQHRERVFILGVRDDLVPEGTTLKEFPPLAPTSTDIHKILLDDKDVPAGSSLCKTDLDVLDLWEELVQHFLSKTPVYKLPTFPMWSDDWDATSDLAALPEWKQKFIRQNRDFYQENKAFLEPWLKKARECTSFTGARRKFEWQCGSFKPGDSLWKLLFQFRPSGIRVKRATYSPALVAMAQIVAVGAKKRKLVPREVARLQSFPDDYKIHPSTSVAYKQFGNSVNVEVIKHMAKHLLNGMV
ncbi:MAG: DNA cytosine methyltransferase [Alphaproteobacteria bacterium]|nr:DNA cytosine methyltransferase [Alphaproteobacteria bacterium]